MNDGKIIIDKIMAEAQERANAILKKGKADADKFIEAVEEKAERQRVALTETATLEADKVKQKEISGAQMRGKKEILEKKQEILTNVLAEAEKELNTLPDEQYAKVIEAMLDKVEKQPEMEIIVSTKDRERLEKTITDKGFVLANETRQIQGGFIAKSGDIEYNYSFESMIAVDKEELQKTAVEILF